MSFSIIKASGEKEPFDEKKFRHSLEKSGADKKTIDELLQRIKKKTSLKTTKQIYNFARNYLTKKDRVIASRYSLKQAIFELGPAGFPFEHFVAALFNKQGYQTETNIIATGWCVDHEVDVIATKNGEHSMIECKFHNRQGLKTDVKVTLYIKARFDDIEKKSQDKKKFHNAWIVTNTKFTSQSVQYAQCADISLLGWSYPQHKSLQNLVETLHLHPITTLVSLKQQTKRAFIKEGFVLCRDAQSNKHILKKLGFSEEQIATIINEAEQVCHLNT